MPNWFLKNSMILTFNLQPNGVILQLYSIFLTETLQSSLVRDHSTNDMYISHHNKNKTGAHKIYQVPSNYIRQQTIWWRLFVYSSETMNR